MEGPDGGPSNIEGLYERMLVPFFFYGSDILTWYEYNQFKVEDVGIDLLRSAFGIRIDRIKNEVVRNVCGVE